MTESRGLSGLWGRAFTDSSHYLVATLIVRALGFVVIPLLTRLFSVEQFAVYDLFLAVHGVLLMLCGLGLDSGTAILLTESRDRMEKLSFLLVLSLVASICSVIIVWAVVFPFVSLFDIDAMSSSLWTLLCVYSALSIISYLMVNFSRWVGRTKTAAYLSLVSSVLGIFVGLALIYLVDREIEYYLAGLTIGALFGSIISLYILKDYIYAFSCKSSDRKYLGEIFSLSLPFVPVYLGNQILQMSDRLLILLLFDMKLLGIYALVTRIASIPSVFINVVRSGFLPVLLKNYASSEGKRFIRQVLHVYFSLVSIGVSVAFLMSNELVQLFGGDLYSQAAPYLPAMVASVLIAASTGLNGFGYTITRRTQRIVSVTYASLALNLVLSYVLAIYLDMAGILLGTLFASVFRAVVYTHCSEKLYDFGYRLGYIGLITGVTCAVCVWSLVGTI